MIVLGFLEKVLRPKSSEIDIEEFLNNLDVEEESMYDNADAFVKPMTLEKDTDKDAVIEEVKKGNIILLNIADLSKRNAVKLRDMVNLIKKQVEAIDGDIAGFGEDYVVAAPYFARIHRGSAIKKE